MASIPSYGERPAADLARLAMDYWRYRMSDFGDGHHRDAGLLFTEQELERFEQIEENAGLRETLERLGDALVQKSMDVDNTLHIWADGTQSTTREHEETRLLQLMHDGLTISTSNIGGAIGMAIGQARNPNDLESQNALAGALSTVGELLAGAGEVVARRHEAKRYRPGDPFQPLYGPGDKERLPVPDAPGAALAGAGPIVSLPQVTSDGFSFDLNPGERTANSDRLGDGEVTTTPNVEQDSTPGNANISNASGNESYVESPVGIISESVGQTPSEALNESGGSQASGHGVGAVGDLSPGTELVNATPENANFSNAQGNEVFIASPVADQQGVGGHEHSGGHDGQHADPAASQSHGSDGVSSHEHSTSGSNESSGDHSSSGHHPDAVSELSPGTIAVDAVGDSEHGSDHSSSDLTPESSESSLGNELDHSSSEQPMQHEEQSQPMHEEQDH